MDLNINKVLDPAVEPFNVVVDGLLLDKETERNYVERMFRETIQKGSAPATLNPSWKVVYRQVKIETIFLCTNWVFKRLEDALKPGQQFPKEPSSDIDVYEEHQFVTMLKKHYPLVECPHDDPECNVIVWGTKHGNDPAVAAHVQVKYNDNWESKMSTVSYVITHGRDDWAAAWHKTASLKWDENKKHPKSYSDAYLKRSSKK
ncbi:hypothetical protein VKT23_008994 [Stygiomarasmius scandens]|uniref:Uncharacterized protein n=1 Tax=Marasmiellus scandens TaxID=2682957 RepID=A0ABR1JKS1_9AGAR